MSTQAGVEDALATGSWVDVAPLLPSVLSTADVTALLTQHVPALAAAPAAGGGKGGGKGGAGAGLHVECVCAVRSTRRGWQAARLPFPLQPFLHACGA